ncbi:MAG: DUF2797 domain-containing protein [Gammaproteobacteria bacterium]|nr:DUF2797 domain-containing protein [Gammaproteobacteria bacterium]
MQGKLRKMITDLTDTVQYRLPLVQHDNRTAIYIDMNKLIGKKIKLTYQHEITCVACGDKTKKSYSQGYCYMCMKSLPECDMCIMKPETCHYAAGTCRDTGWGDEFCMQPHFVYLANSSGIKVGITRGTQIPTRWMDQGAVQALPIFKVKNRLMSGLLEVLIKKHVSDKTDWRKMLKGVIEEVDLIKYRDEIVASCKDEIDALIKVHGEDALTALNEELLVDISYPVHEYPEKVKSFNFDKTPEIEGVLKGIKGQYLILDSGVLNIRKFTGYNIALEHE